jgi:hypothetical protein
MVLGRTAKDIYRMNPLSQIANFAINIWVNFVFSDTQKTI